MGRGQGTAWEVEMVYIEILAMFRYTTFQKVNVATYDLELCSFYLSISPEGQAIMSVSQLFIHISWSHVIMKSHVPNFVLYHNFHS